MTEQDIDHIYNELVKGKVVLLSDVDYGYGDRTQTFLRYSSVFNTLRYEVYNLHGNGEELIKTEPVAKKHITKLLGNDLQKATQKLSNIDLYPWVK